MPRQTAPQSTDLPPPPLVHRLPVARLDREGDEPNRVRLAPDAEARARIARFLDIEAVERLTLTGRLMPVADGWEFRGQLTATVVQACVVTLDPVRATIDAPVRRRFLAHVALPEDGERVLDADELEPPEPLGDAIDLGAVAVETLALSLDPWPRSEGAALDAGAPAGEDGDAAPERPFAALAALRGKLDRNDG